MRSITKIKSYIPVITRVDFENIFPEFYNEKTIQKLGVSSREQVTSEIVPKYICNVICDVVEKHSGVTLHVLSEFEIISDTVTLTFGIDNEGVTSLQGYLKRYNEPFRQYLAKFISNEGEISDFSTDPLVWLSKVACLQRDAFKRSDLAQSVGVTLGEVVGFILENEGYCETRLIRFVKEYVKDLYNI